MPNILLRQIVQHAQPVVRIGIGIGDVVAGLIHAEVAREQDALLGQIRDGVAARVARPHAYQFHAMGAVIQHHLVAEAELRMLQPIRLQAGLARCPCCPSTAPDSSPSTPPYTPPSRRWSRPHPPRRCCRMQ